MPSSRGSSWPRGGSCVPCSSCIGRWVLHHWTTKESKVKVAQWCLTLFDPMDYTVHGILQDRILECVAFPFSRGSSQPRDWTEVSRVAGGFFTSWAIREAELPGNMHFLYFLWMKKKISGDNKNDKDVKKLIQMGLQLQENFICIWDVCFKISLYPTYKHWTEWRGNYLLPRSGVLSQQGFWHRTTLGSCWTNLIDIQSTLTNFQLLTAQNS